MKRTLNLLESLGHHSAFLFGSRGVGKSFLIREQIASQAQVINLLQSKIYLNLRENPAQLQEMLVGNLTVIDEIQRIPELLNEVHFAIEERKHQFLLTGSSARKLKHRNANLLAGRARILNLYPLTWNELVEDSKFSLEKYLRWGGLPEVLLKCSSDQEREDFLYAYVDTYLREEVEKESRIRNLPAFSRFLSSAGRASGEILNFTSLAEDAQVSPHTVREYYHVLEDTLVGFQLPPWKKGLKRKSVSTSKFYFFDLGVTHTLKRIEHLERASDLYGKAFEHFIAMELRAFISYIKIRKEFTFWRSVHNHEVDFIIGNDVAIEVKSTKRVVASDEEGLRKLKEEQKIKRLILVSQDEISFTTREGIEHMHWQDFLKKLWSGKVLH